MNASLADRLDALLPQTQCTRCGYEGCRPYAEAMAAGRADANRCPPGGEPVLAALAQALARAPLPLDPGVGPAMPPQVARIEEDACIGCTKCIQACPVDAIVGASKLMHTVIAAWCTGCELCIAPCPVDCIRLVPAPALPDAGLSRRRHLARGERQARAERERAERLAAYE
jgi:electron transport complex protein RnfB